MPAKRTRYLSFTRQIGQHGEPNLFVWEHGRPTRLHANVTPNSINRLLLVLKPRAWCRDILITPQSHGWTARIP
jgi:hypothetical protein